MSINGKERISNMVTNIKRNNANEIKLLKKEAKNKIMNNKQKELSRRVELAAQIRKMEINIRDQLNNNEIEKNNKFLEDRIKKKKFEEKLLTKKNKELK